MYVVLDADALWMVGQDLSLVKGYRKAVLTPNVMEFKRLSDQAVRVRVCSPRDGHPYRLSQGIDPKSPPDEHAMRISRVLGGVTILQNNKEDIIATDTGSTVSLPITSSDRH